MAGDHQPVLAVAEFDQQESQQRRHRRIEPLGPLPRHQLLDPVGGVGPREPAEVFLTPRQYHFPGDDLHGPCAVHLAEARAQRRVPGHQRLPGRP